MGWTRHGICSPFSHVGHQKMIWQFDILSQSWGKATWSLEYFLWLYHDRMAASNTLDSWEPQHEFCWLFLSWMSLSSKIIKDEPKPSCLSKLMHLLIHAFGQRFRSAKPHGIGSMVYADGTSPSPDEIAIWKRKLLVYYQYQTQIETVAQFEAFVIAASVKKHPHNPASITGIRRHLALQVSLMRANGSMVSNSSDTKITAKRCWLAALIPGVPAGKGQWGTSKALHILLENRPIFLGWNQCSHQFSFNIYSIHSFSQPIIVFVQHRFVQIFPSTPGGWEGPRADARFLGTTFTSWGLHQRHHGSTEAP